jgi:hypothetical protein
MDREFARFRIIIIAVFSSVAVLMLAIAAISAVSTVRALAREQTAAGRVADLTVRRDRSGNELYYPVVEFQLPDGSTKTVQMPEGSWPAAYEAGESVTVAYDPDRPRDARIQSATSAIGMWIVPIITGALGVAFTAATFLARRVLRTGPGGG